MRIIPMEHQLYILDDGRVRAFLILGKSNALLIDTGFADSGVFKAVRSITALPVAVLLTHADGDHAGGLEKFGACYVMEGDRPLLPAGVTALSMAQGDIFTCGAYCLEVIAIPGHTSGSAAFFDRKKGLLISGDSVQKDGPIFMFGPHRNLEQYIASQRKLLGMVNEIRVILPSHHDCPIGPEYIERNLLDALALQAGQLPSSPHPQFPCREYQGRWTIFYFE